MVCIKFGLKCCVLISVMVADGGPDQSILQILSIFLPNEPNCHQEYPKLQILIVRQKSDFI
jgi:hypothetical protein